MLNCDACKYAIGATLQQDHGNGLQPVAYFSAKMTRRRAQLRRARAGVHGAAASACLHWRHYLHGTQPFTLLTDHDSLKYHKTMPNLTGRLARWVEKMAEFDYKLQHIPGKDNVVADALSRRADLAAAARVGQVRRRAGILKQRVAVSSGTTVHATPDAAQRACDGAKSPDASARDAGSAPQRCRPNHWRAGVRDRRRGATAASAAG